MSEDTMTIEKFIKNLGDWEPNDDGLENLDIINMYNNSEKYGKSVKEKYSKIINICINNWEDEAYKKQERLRLYLKRMKELNPSRLFVGEAPGIDGCYRTGIPFTSEAIISGVQTSIAFSWYFKDSQIYCEGKQREKTSTIVWGCLDHLGCLDQICKLLSKIPFMKEVKSIPQGVKLPLLWNIFPFQPLKNAEKENRKENGELKDKECEEGIKFLFNLLRCFDINEIYPVGEHAEKTLRKLLKKEFPEIKLRESLCHPAAPRGGATKFRKKFNEIYQIEIDESEDSEE